MTLRRTPARVVMHLMAHRMSAGSIRVITGHHAPCALPSLPNLGRSWPALAGRARTFRTTLG